MIRPNEKHDLVRVTTQRDAIGRMIHNPQENQPPCAPPNAPEKKLPASASTQPELTPPSITEPTPGTANAPPATAPASAPPMHASTEDSDDADEDPPRWVQEASLSELLLWRLGIPADRERIERERQTDTISLKPPITTRKVADAIAQISLRIMNGELDATSAKTSLYALQTLLTALRLQIVEEKKAKDSRKKKQKPIRKKHANRKR